MKLNSIYLIILGVFLVMLLLAPPAVFLSNFYNHPISHDPQLWGVLGDYIGGLTNPIISLASLIVLGYLTHLVNKQSNNENKRLIFLEKKLVAYDELSKYVKDLNAVSFKMNQAMAFTEFGERTLGQMEEVFKELLSLSSIYKEFYFLIRYFPVRYSHLFEYDFSNDDYVALVKETNTFANRYQEWVYSKINMTETNINKDDLILSERYVNLLQNVLTKICSEVAVNITMQV